MLLVQPIVRRRYSERPVIKLRSETAPCALRPCALRPAPCERRDLMGWQPANLWLLSTEGALMSNLCADSAGRTAQRSRRSGGNRSQNTLSTACEESLTQRKAGLVQLNFSRINSILGSFRVTQKFSHSDKRLHSNQSDFIELMRFYSTRCIFFLLWQHNFRG